MMVQIIITAIAAVLCGMAAGRRGVPVALGVAAAICFGIFGGSLARFFGPAAGLLGTLISCSFCVGLFAFLPASHEVEDISSPHDGLEHAAREFACPKCRHMVASGSRVCPRCMTKLDEIPSG